MSNKHHDSCFENKDEKMFGSISKEKEVNLSASELWQVYGLLTKKEFVTNYIPHIISKSEVLDGGGGAGTILKLTFSPGNFPFESQIERYTKVDMEKRILEAEVIEGGHLDLGFNLLRFRMKINEINEKSCNIRWTIEYEVEEGADLNLTVLALQFLLNTAKAIIGYALKNKQA